MKAFTDINQSKKLAEILPPESADMSWTNNKLKKEVSVNLSSVVEMRAYYDSSIYEWDRFYELTPCWSLAALLGQMICPKLENYVQNIWDLDAAMDNTLQRWLSVQDCQTAVDACVEMIIKLHERKLL